MHLLQELTNFEKDFAVIQFPFLIKVYFMKIMMVCLGNICRSPLAHGIMQSRIDAQNLPWSVASCGTSAWHVGEKPDKRSIEIAAENDVDIRHQKAQQFKQKYFQEYDHIIVMDASNYNDVISKSSSIDEKAKVSMLLNYTYPGENRQVPDPYYAGGFQYVFDLVSEAVDAFVRKQVG